MEAARPWASTTGLLALFIRGLPLSKIPLSFISAVLGLSKTLFLTSSLDRQRKPRPRAREKGNGGRPQPLVKWGVLPSARWPCWRNSEEFWGPHPLEIGPVDIPQTPVPPPAWALPERWAFPGARGTLALAYHPPVATLASARCPWDAERGQPGGPALPTQLRAPSQLRGSLGSKAGLGGCSLQVGSPDLSPLQGHTLRHSSASRTHRTPSPRFLLRSCPCACAPPDPGSQPVLGAGHGFTCFSVSSLSWHILQGH